MRNLLAAAVAITTIVLGVASTASAADDVIRIQTANISTDPATGMRAIDPARTRSPHTWMIEYQTCALLYNHPDVDKSTGGRAQPEVATDYPGVSPDGLTYTFTLRSDYRFSDGTSVTPSAYKREIERVKAFPQATEYAADIDLANSVADDANSTLTLKLTAPHADIVDRLAMPFFCPVPPGTPIPLAPTDPRPPDSGPYMRAPLPSLPTTAGDISLSLVRNPYYSGSRPRNAAEIDFVYEPSITGIYPGVNSGAYDAATGMAAGDYSTAANLWGPSSANATAGHQRFYVAVADGMDYLALRSSPGFPLNDVRLRRAVNYLLNRSALVNILTPYAATPWSQFVPPSVPGFTSSPLYPLTPDLASAQALVASTGLTTPIPLRLYTGTGGFTIPWGQGIKAQLENGGLFSVTITQVPPPGSQFYSAISNPATQFDLALTGWILDYFDPADFIVPLMHRNGIPTGTPGATYNFSYFDSDAWLDGSGNTWTSRFDAASAVAAPLRYNLFNGIAADIASSAPIAPIDHVNWRIFVSDRIGCVTVHPVYQLALGALCVPPADPTSTAARETVDANGVVATTGDATAADPVVTSVTTPVAGTVTINEASSPTEVAPANYSFFGREVTIEAPQASTTSPLTLSFTLDLSLLNGADPLSVVVFRDGAPISTPCAAGTAASPDDPCVVAPNQVVGDDVTVTVRSSHASRWNFGRNFVFNGFFQPVDAYPIVNSMKAGAAVPIKFSLGGNLGLSIFWTGYPVSSTVACSSASPVDAVEQTVASDSSKLTYDASTGQYNFVWKTDKTWAGTCRQLVMRFASGAERRANFKFTK